MRARKTALAMTITSLTAALCAMTVPGSASAQAAVPASRLTFGQAASGAHRAVAHRAATSITPAVTGIAVRIDSLYTVTTGQCLDADATNGANGTKVQTWGCNGSAQQEWISWSDYSIESVKFPGMCLDADTNGGGANGTKVQLWQCNGSTQQQWFVRANDLAIYNEHFNNNLNTVLDRDTNVPGNGAKAQLWQKNYQSQQWWSIVTA